MEIPPSFAIFKHPSLKAAQYFILFKHYSLKDKILYIAFLLMGLLCACGDKVNVVPDNDPSSDFNISDLKIENYINRLFIDLIAREPTDIELAVNLDSLKSGDLGREHRLTIIRKLMTDTTPQINEGSYKEAYHRNLYNLAKVRCLENSTDQLFRTNRQIILGGAKKDSILGKWKRYYAALNAVRRYDNLLQSEELLLEGIITFRELFAPVIDNPTYDRINMNTFNFVRATFDQLLWRLPTEQEYNSAFEMIENGIAGEIFGQKGTNKDDYISILINSWGMYEGMIIWAFQNYLQRPPESDELYSLLSIYSNDKDIDIVLEKILATDEYANFQ